MNTKNTFEVTAPDNTSIQFTSTKEITQVCIVKNDQGKWELFSKTSARYGKGLEAWQNRMYREFRWGNVESEMRYVRKVADLDALQARMVAAVAQLVTANNTEKLAILDTISALKNLIEREVNARTR